METKYLYFIENEQHQWWWCSLEVDKTNTKTLSGWTNDPLKAFSMPSLEIMNKIIINDKKFENCRITEHEFFE